MKRAHLFLPAVRSARAVASCAGIAWCVGIVWCAGVGCGGNTTKSRADGGAGSDAGAQALTPDPARVDCGSMVCDTASSQCCVVPASSAMPTSGASCNGKTEACPGHVLECDEAADCAPQQVCCYSVFQNAFPDDIGSQCAPNCIRNSIAYQACKSDVDCGGTGMACVANTCGGQTIGTCGALPPALCRP
jgi:hypothetical protein